MVDVHIDPLMSDREGEGHGRVGFSHSSDSKGSLVLSPVIQYIITCIPVDNFVNVHL